MTMISKSMYESLYNKSDIVFKTLKHGENHWKNWGRGVFIGNGMLGAMAFKKTADGVTLELGRNDVEAHNHLARIDWTYPRIPIGDLKISANEETLNESAHLHLYNAFIDCAVTTNAGEYVWEAFCANDFDVIVVRLYKSAGQAKLKLDLIPEYGVSPKYAYQVYKVEPEIYNAASPLPPQFTVFSQNGVDGWRQPLVNDNGEISGGYSVAVASEEDDIAQIYYVAICHNRTGDDAWDDAYNTALNAKAVGYDDLFKTHCDYWHNYYSESYLEFSDDKWQSFYNIQMYKLGCATRENAMEVIDSQGPWLTKTGWPGTWWNLNVQLSYSPLYTANHLGIARSLVNTIKDREAQLRKNAKPVTDDGIYIHRASGRMLDRNNIYTPEQIKRGDYVCFELGNITWIMFTIYRHFRFSMDERLLRETLFPLLKAAINVYIAICYEMEDGKIHLPKTTSPEYPGPFNPTGNSCPWEDAAYDVALFRWGLKTLIALSDEYNIEDSLYPIWQDTLSRLCDIPTDQTGINVARGMPYAISHRHYSHLFDFFPLHLLDMNNEDDRVLADKSLTHWQSLPEKLVGYSCTGASCMASTLGDGNRALMYLDKLLQLDETKAYVTPNTMYLEPVGGPVIETPITAAEALHYMFLQSYGGIIRVFPAVPDSIENVYFERLLCEGAFEVSAKRQNGKNLWVKVESKVGGKMIVDAGLVGEITAEGATKNADGLWEADTKQGDIIVFYSGAKPSDI